MENRDMLVRALTRLEDMQKQITDWREEDRQLKRDLCARVSSLEEWKHRSVGELVEAEKHAVYRHKTHMERIEKTEQSLEEHLPMIREAHSFIQDSRRLFWAAVSAVIAAGVNILLTLYLKLGGG